MSAGGVKGVLLNVKVTAKGFCFQFLSLFLSLPNLEKNPKHWGKYAVEYYAREKNERMAAICIGIHAVQKKVTKKDML